jgi:arylsulfatase A-like enzyme
LVVATAGVVATASAWWGGCRRQAGERAQPADNLVLITIDTLRADHLGAYGYGRDTSPAIDRVAAGGTLFEQAGVQWPKTNPSMASMLTSTYNTTNGVRHYGAPMDSRLTSLAEIMHEAGYYCASFVANAHLGRFFNFDDGFDEVHELWGDTDHAHPLSLNYVDTYNNDRIAAEVSRWIAEHGDRRFFLWVHLLDPHGPYEPPADLKSRYVGDKLYEEQNIGVALANVPLYQRREGMAVLSDYVARYDGEIAYSDRVVEKVLAALEQGGLVPKTLLVVTADHGESLGEHDYYFDHGGYMYEACLRVPLVFFQPGKIPAGRRVARPVGMIDLLPTLLELLGIEAGPYRAGFQGRSFGALIRGEPMDERAVFAEGNKGQLSIRRGKWKLIDDPRADPKTKRVRLQLYDLSRDPMETDNLAERFPDIAAGLHGELKAWKGRLEETIGRYESQQVDPKLLPEDVRRFLNATGYAGGPEEETESDGE